MSTNDDPRGFRRGSAPANREYSQQRNQQRNQQQRDRYEQFPQQGDPRSAPRAQPERPQPSFSAYKPEAYAKGKEPQGPGGHDRSGLPKRQAPRPSRADMAPPPLPEPSMSDPYSMPDMSNDPFYQPAASDPYASSGGYSRARGPSGFDSDNEFDNVGDFNGGPDFNDDGGFNRGDDFDNGNNFTPNNNWENDEFGVDANQFQSFYPQNEQPGFDGDPQSVHDEFFAGTDQALNDIPPPPLPGNGHHAQARDPQPRDTQVFDDFHSGNLGEFDQQGYDDDFGAPHPHQHMYDDQDDGFEAEPMPHDRGMEQPRGQQPRGEAPGFNDQYDWDDFEQPPAPSAVRAFHPPAIRDDDLDADYFADEDEYELDEYEGGSKKKLLAAVLAGAIVIGGGGAYIYSSGNGSFDSGGAPSVIVADSTPVKEQPEAPGGRDFPNGNKLIYDRLGGGGGGATQASAAGANQPPAPVPGLVTSTGNSNAASSGTLEQRIENALRAQGGNQQPAAPNPIDTPRAVQTLTFGPDGSQQPVQQQPVQPQQLAANGAGVNQFSSDIVVSTQPSSSPNFASVQATPATGSVQANVQPQPQQQQIAAINPQANVAPVGTGAYFVQIGARNDPQAATEAFKTLQQRYASVIGNYAPSLRKADLGAKGVWYRLWVGPVNTKGEAETLCDQLKTAGMQACLVRKDQ
ncbi:MAG: SPOR domain-containing protein [Hyphomicrobiales bacterium]|nr:SPOR domain-containing protein [Hyphomicrobiales bacterium]